MCSRLLTEPLKCIHGQRPSLAVLGRKTALPLINKRWARVMREPSHAWLDAEVGCGSICDDDADCDDEEKEERKLARQDADKLRKATTALSWFTRRPGWVAGICTCPRS